MITIHIAPKNYSSLQVELGKKVFNRTLILAANASRIEGVGV
jgi:hypothetical protein